MPSLSRGDSLSFDSGSYRDRDGRVICDDGIIRRLLSPHAAAEWDAVRQTQFFQSALDSGMIVRTIPDPEASPEHFGPQWAAVLRHDTIPFVSYPYEWPFGMLQDAALLKLELLLAALEEDVTLKDGTAYNIQWHGTAPVFIDVASFERLTPGQAWAGYRQFCQTLLFPLMLQAYKGIDFHPWLRGRLDGISPQDCWKLMSVRDFFRRGVPAHVFLHSKLQSSTTLEAADTSASLRNAGFHKEMIRNNALQLRRLVQGLHWSPGESTWSGYADANSYTAAERDLKVDFVRRVTCGRHWEQVWDLGCNTGTFSRIAAENADLVVALDSDHLAVERLYRSLKDEAGPAAGRILPLVGSIVDQPAGLGWRGAERRALTDRGRPQLVLCLALVHHLVIGNGVPVDELIDWLADMECELVIEYVAKDDPMVRRLLRGRRDNYADYEADEFERLLASRFAIVRKEPLPSGTRSLYHAKARETD